jgi:hypothetical protein
MNRLLTRYDSWDLSKIFSKTFDLLNLTQINEKVHLNFGDCNEFVTFTWNDCGMTLTEGLSHDQY